MGLIATITGLVFYQLQRSIKLTSLNLKTETYLLEQTLLPTLDDNYVLMLLYSEQSSKLTKRDMYKVKSYCSEKKSSRIGFH
jgi:hypothetical protein